VGNIYGEVHPFCLEFKPDAGSVNLVHEAEITVKLDNALYQAWQTGGTMGVNIENIGGQTVLVKGNNANLCNLIFGSHEIGQLFVQFNFLTQEITEQANYTFHVIQTDYETGDIIGGETYQIHKSPRTPFYANAGEDIYADIEETVFLSAESIGEDAIYNWYDEFGTLVHEGMDFTFMVSAAQKYTLEVTAVSDGFKDYDEVEVKLNTNEILTIYPNPVYENITISCGLDNANDAIIRIIMPNGRYFIIILGMFENSITFNISGFPMGLYVVDLIYNGEFITKTFMKF
jgi:hypothetical protein